MRALVVLIMLCGTASAGRGNALLKYLPEDVSMVLVADVAHARGSPLVPQGTELLTRHASRWRNITGLDEVIDTCVFAETGEIRSGAAHDAYTIIDGKVDTLVHALATDRVFEHAGVKYYKLDDAAELAVVDKHLVIAPPGGMPALIDRAHGKGANASTSDKAAALRAALATTGGTDLWGGIVFDASARKLLAQTFTVEVAWASLSMAVATGATLDVRFGFTDEDGAKTFAALADQKLAEPDTRSTIGKLAGDGFVANMTVERDRTAVRVAGAMTSDDVQILVRTVNTAF